VKAGTEGKASRHLSKPGEFKTLMILPTVWGTRNGLPGLIPINMVSLWGLKVLLEYSTGKR